MCKMTTEKNYTPHVHAEVIKAWADGKPIQYLHKECWKTYTPEDGDDAGPAWHASYRYRVKPEEVVRYTIVHSSGIPGGHFFASKEEVSSFYQREDTQGFCKRTTIDGKVVAIEFIPS